MSSWIKAVGWGLLTCVLYLGFNFFCFNVFGTHPEFLGDREWTETTLMLALLLYAILMVIFFGAYGFAISRIVLSSRLLLWGAVLPFFMSGVVIWFITYRSIGGSTSEIGGIHWIPYLLYTFWAMPLIEAMKSYITDPTNLKVSALLLLFLPGMGIVLGVWLANRIRSSATFLIRLAILPGVLLACFLASLFLKPSTPFTLNSYPKVDGATAAIPFGKLLLGEMTGINKFKANYSVIFNTTHNAYVNLIEKRADLIFVAGPSDEEQQLARQNGVTLKLTPIGRDAFIFLVHQDNGIQGLTTAQLQQIYSGKATNWKEVGGDDHKIIAFQREKNSGSQTYMEQKVMKDLILTDPPTEKKSGGMGGLIDAVADYKNSENAIGYSFYYFANEMHKRESVRFLPINGVEPSKEHIRNKTYPYTASLYAVTREDEPVDSPASRLLQWILSPEGSKLIEKGGFVPEH